MKTLRQSLFRSHLVVMVVALVVAILIAGLVGVLLSAFDDPLHGGRRGGPVVLLLPIGAAVAASALVSWFVTRRMIAPLHAVRDAAGGLAGGNYSIRVETSDIQELDELGQSMNVLAEALEQTEKRRLELIGDVAHELRNPLATIEASMEGLMDGVTVADDETFALVSGQAARLGRLARDLSDLSASSESTVGDRFEPVDLVSLIGDVTGQLAHQAAAKDLVVRFDAALSPLSVMGDGDRLTQVLVNVIGNAIQYSDQGEITVTAGIDGAAAIVTVTDAGRGLEPDDVTRVFERFYRVDRTYSDGTGVGLAIAKAIVEAHEGTIVASSPGVGQGTVMTLRLPLSLSTD